MTDTELPIRHIFRWDLDKTYLRTDFDTLRDLIRTAMQKPEEKVNVPGVVTLLKELTRPGPNGRALVTFISGSPTQMRTRLERKFEIDGIEPDVFILKPTLQNILKGRFKAVRGQVGYKLDTLLRVRAHSPPAPETLFGDDAEQDAFIYSLYADLAAGRIDEVTLREILSEAHVYSTTRQSIMEHFATLNHEGTVGRIFIHLDRYTAPGRFWVYGPRVVPITNYFQTALILYSDEVLEASSVIRVAAGMISGADYGIHELANSFQDLTRRRHLDAATIDRLAAEIPHAEDYAAVPPQFMDRLLARVRALAPRSDGGQAKKWEGPPDYIAVLRADKKLRDLVKEEGRGPGLFS
ncbi:MAG: phosphatase domain-containing protein [Bradymonadaceae bacterium]